MAWRARTARPHTHSAQPAPRCKLVYIGAAARRPVTTRPGVMADTVGRVRPPWRLWRQSSRRGPNNTAPIGWADLIPRLYRASRCLRSIARIASIASIARPIVTGPKKTVRLFYRPAARQHFQTVPCPFL